jgi:SSS family transporter
MPAWAVALSVVATAISAATFVGAPAQSYSGNLTYLSATLGQFIAIVLVAAFFIPVYYRENVATVYDLIGQRYGPNAKQACSWMFMIGRVFANGARLFMAGLAGSQMVYSDGSAAHVMLCIGVLSIVGVAYTWLGGIRAVIWTEVIQTIVLVGAAMVAIGLLLHRIPVSPGRVLNVLNDAKTATGSKLDALRIGVDASKPWFGLDLSQPYTLVTAALCWTIFNLAAYGTDHDLAQRMLTCRNAFQGGKSAIGAILIGLPITALFMAIGLLLYIFYDRPDVMGSASTGPRPGEAKEVFLTFISIQMPRGLGGLMMAGMFAAALSSLSSALNAMAATFVNDVYRRVRPGLDDSRYLFVGRASMLAWGVVLGLFACVCVFWQEYNAKLGGQTLIDFALGVMNFAYAGLAAVFSCAIFTRRGNQATAIAALVTGFLVVLLMQPWMWKHWAGLIAWTEYTPTSSTIHSLAEVKLAFPWQLFMATSLAFIVCVAGPRREKSNG